MDLANLISQPGPEPAMTVRSRYSPPAFEPGTFYSANTSFTRTQAPLSPPVEDRSSKCSLPSISALLDSADGASTQATSKPSSSLSDLAQSNIPVERQRLSSPVYREAFDKNPAAAAPIRLPPTPPLRPGSGFHSAGHSPSSSISSISMIKTEYPQPPALPVSLPGLPSPTDRSSISSQGSAHHQHHGHGPYASPAPSVAPSYSSPVEPSPSAAMYYQHQHQHQHQRPASAGTYQAPPPPPPSHQQPMISPVTPAWQHHHYFPPSSNTPYQQNHDRYICRTCHKAFSRPSSLRIHSHSHTGEKPFRCTHAGCGKAFSVRSNMKRHERGCHSGRAVAMV
ncbi:C2H2-type zinc finger protein [Aspergillus mulundensis]|uniref:C2H2-type domain-containing protein n=1 Tax=Aspergillus mulundensis TaxID=1810919 RepID=A0A3D8RF27_9EURO|nr:hypothetical protein DSM5745_07738 [Aspergillus mulundensis]RDW72566.1 hypothetical protein DSM5745_07738 [Aspergillus mulundensis]